MKLRCVVAALLLWLLTPSAHAQTPTPLAEWQYSAGIALLKRFENPIPTWQSEVTLGGILEPAYEGSDVYKLYPAPSFAVRYKDRFFLSTGEGLGVNLISTLNCRAGLAITYDLGHAEHDNHRLAGLGDINPAPETKLFGEYVLFPVILRGDIRRAIGGYDSITGDLGAYMPVLGTKKYVVFMGPSLAFGDDDYMRRYWGVSPSQSQRSGYAPYNTHGGFKSASFGISGNWFISEHYFVNADTAIERLLGSAADSPIAVERIAYTLAISFGYQF